MPGAASAATPDVSFVVLTPTGPTTAEVDGTVNPGGEATTYAVEYDFASSSWCTSNGTGTPTFIVNGTDAIPADNTDHEVTANLTGLTAGYDYCAEFVASNSSGDGHIGPMPWTQGDASALTNDAFSTADGSARVDGTVDAAGQGGATYQVQWNVASSDWCTSNGTSGSPASTTTPATFNFSDGAYHDVPGVIVTGLTLGTDYCAQLFASNPAYGGSGGGRVEWTQGAPSVIGTGEDSSSPAYSTGPTTALVTGYIINPVEQAATVQVEYDLAGSEWCTSGGTSGSPAYQSANYSTSDIGPRAPIELTDDLTAGQDYCGEMTATNLYGTGLAYSVAWTQGAPTVTAPDGSPTAATTATFTALVDPAGGSTSYVVEYDTLSSSWCSSGGTSGSPTETSSTLLTPTDGTFHSVSADLSGLSPNTSYCGEVVASNGVGTGDSVQVSWTQPEVPDYTLTLSVSGPGAVPVTSSPAGINCGWIFTACSSDFQAGTRLTLTAAHTSIETISWVGAPGCAAGGPTCTVTMNANQTVGAVFATTTLTQTAYLYVEHTGGPGTITSSPAGIDCGSAGGLCSYAFPVGTQVTLAATPDTGLGATFEHWSGGSCTGTGTGTCTVAVTASGTPTITATFDPGAPPTCRVRRTSKVVLIGLNAGILSLSMTCDQDVSYVLTGGVTVHRRVWVRKRHHKKRVRRNVSYGSAIPEVDGQAKAGVPTVLSLELPASALSRLRQHRAAWASAGFEVDAENANGAGGDTGSLGRFR